jgi:ribosomal RNA-processing protein 36
MSTYSSEDEISVVSNKIGEEQYIQDQLEEIEFGKLINAQKKLDLKSKKIEKNLTNEDFDKINQTKTKNEPKEYSAVIKQKGKIKNIQKQLRRDPRFDDLSGNLNIESYKKNFSFVKEFANDYLGKIKEVKSKRKNLNDNDYELIKKQVNLVKGWVKQNQYKNLQDEIKQDIKHENKQREEEGKNPIFFKKQQMKQIVATTKMEQRNESEQKKFIKRKKTRDTKKLKNKELI